MDKIMLKAHAKLNLNLEITGQREDGYHTLDSTFQAIELHDIITIRKLKRGFRLLGKFSCELEKNTIYKAKKALEDFIGNEYPCEITIQKNIPSQAGLGGGSTDAAAVIMGLNELFSLGLVKEQLLQIGVSVGADVPFFLLNNATAHVSGIGEVIEPTNKEPSKYYVLAKPNEGLSTKEMFDEYDISGKSFTETAMKKIPRIRHLIDFFAEESEDSGMSGSGSCVFVGVNSYKHAEKIIKDFGFTDDMDWYITKPSKKTYRYITN
jgi:4-diphosphocytidyl-2-C-methyl-D-erythritol kinase